MNSVEVNYRITMGIRSLCELMYRRGAKDASFIGDSSEVEAFCRETESDGSVRFINNDFGRITSENHFIDALCVLARAVQSNTLAHHLSNGKSKRMLRRAIPRLAMAFYRKGLYDGCGLGADEGEDFLLCIGTGKRHRTAVGKVIPPSAFMDQIKLELFKLDSGMDDDNKVHSKLRDFIAKALEEMEMLKEAGKDV